MSGTGVSLTAINGAGTDARTEDNNEDADAGTAVSPQCETESGLIVVYPEWGAILDGVVEDESQLDKCR